MQNLVHPFAGIARNRTCPSNLDTLKTKTRCQANGMPWKIADSRHFLCKHAIVQVPKSKNATIMLLYSHHFLKISKNTLRPPSYLRISMTFAVLQMGFSVNLRVEANTPHRSLVFCCRHNATRPSESTRPKRSEKMLRVPGDFNASIAGTKVHQELSRRCFFLRGQNLEPVLFETIYYLCL